MRRTKEDAEKTRELILHTALHCFDQQGYETTSLNDIARKVGMTRGAIYWHFKNKADLFRTIAEQYHTEIYGDMEKALTNEHTWCHITRSLLRFFHLLHDDPDCACFFRIMEQAKKHYSPFLTSVNAEYSTLWQQFSARAIALGKDSGDIHPDIDPEWAHLFLLSMIMGLLTLHLHHFSDYPNLMSHSARIIRTNIMLLRSSPL